MTFAVDREDARLEVGDDEGVQLGQIGDIDPASRRRGLGLAHPSIEHMREQCHGEEDTSE